MNMTRQKKIEQEKQIEALIYLFIEKQEAFDWWLDNFLFYQIAFTLNCSVHKVKRVFYKKIMKENYDWLMNFTY